MVDQDTPLGGYPISRYVYWYIKKDAREYESCYQAWLVYKFIEWTFTDPLAEEIAVGHGWVVPPESVVELALAKLNEIQCIDDEASTSDDTNPNVIFVADYTPPPYQELEETDDSSNLIQVIVPTMVCALLIIAAILGYVYIELKRRQADSVWSVKLSELGFGSDPEVIGKGSFGMVVLAEYRGTKVAAKRVIPPAKTDDTEETNTNRILYDTEEGATFNPGLWSLGIHKTLMMDKPRPTTFRGRAFERKLRHRTLKTEFVAEMRQLAKLRHPNITTTMGAVLSPGEEPMLVMELMHNGSLYDAIRNDTINLNSQDDILTIVQDVAHGLRFLHSANPRVIHGDLKTKNVLIDDNFRAKVADFGLSDKTQMGARGTPYWMAPELLMGTSTNTPMSDVYAFGILLYEVYARKNPYEGEDYEEVLRLVCDPAACKRPPVPTLCPPKIATLMTDCLQGNPQDRPAMKEIDSVLQAEGTIQGRVFRIEALNKDLVETNKKISSEQATQLGHFACMSHEIRTPLNCIIGVSSLLESDNNLNASHKESVNMIVSSGNLLKQVVDDVLDFSKFVSGNAEIDIERTNLQETLGNIVNSMQLSSITKRKKISLRTFYDPLVPQYVETDGRRLQQIFYNLLSNAVKFSAEKGNVDLTASVQSAGATNEQDGAHLSASLRDLPELHLHVTDYGKGIESSDFDKIFQPFQQTEDGINNQDGGTGLGLAITKQLVELLGGSISVDSKVGEWTKFSIRFPLTVSLADAPAISKKLTNCCVWLISNTGENTQYVTNACEHFNVKQLHFESWNELDEQEMRKSQGNKGKTCVCLVQEDLYNASIYESLSKRDKKTILVTFGPEGKVDRGQVHYQSLTRVFPSVFIQELGSLCDYASLASRLAPPKPKSESQVSFEGLKILVADDNRVNQKVLVRMLERLGTDEPTIADNGKLAVEAEAAESFDIVLMDMQMPVMDGIEACRLIVARSETPPKVVFLTAHVADDFKGICIENGATDYLSKLLALPDLRAMLEKLISE